MCSQGPAKTNNQQYDVNEIVKVRCGTAHLPPRRGDKGTMCKSFIGGELYKMRADGEIIADVLDIVAPKPADVPREIVLEEVPSDLPIDQHQAAISTSRLDDLDRLYEDSDDDEPAASPVEGLEERLQLLEKVALSNFHEWDLCALAFDTAWDYIDLLMDEEWDDTTEEGREERAKKLRSLARECNDTETRALHDGPVFSEYQNVN